MLWSRDTQGKWIVGTEELKISRQVSPTPAGLCRLSPPQAEGPTKLTGGGVALSQPLRSLDLISKIMLRDPSWLLRGTAWRAAAVFLSISPAAL